MMLWQLRNGSCLLIIMFIKYYVLVVLVFSHRKWLVNSKKNFHFFHGSCSAMKIILAPLSLFLSPSHTHTLTLSFSSTIMNSLVRTCRDDGRSGWKTIIRPKYCILSELLYATANKRKIKQVVWVRSDCEHMIMMEWISDRWRGYFFVDWNYWTW